MLDCCSTYRDPGEMEPGGERGREKNGRRESAVEKGMGDKINQEVIHSVTKCKHT